MLKFIKFSIALALLLTIAIGAPAVRQQAVAQGPDYVTYNSYNGDPTPRAFDEKVVQHVERSEPADAGGAFDHRA